jgi:ABC-type branched-subunit amino acid transport system ATPase component
MTGSVGPGCIAPAVPQAMADTLFATCDIIMVMSYGRLPVTSTRDQIRNRPQVADVYLRLADRAYVLSQGRVQFEGPIASLVSNDAVRRKYLSV